MIETPLEMARRYVREGADRIRRQERLVAELQRDGHMQIVPQARRILERMREYQHNFEDHLADLEKKA
jgi:hypothetical protein